MEDQLLKTLCYADIFDYPLTVSELYRFLIGRTPYSFPQIKEKLSKKLPFAERVGPYYVLSGRGEIVGRRCRQRSSGLKKMKKAKRVGRLLSCIPFIKLIGVSGSLAANNAAPGDDIDLFIITQGNRLWITRFLATMILFFLGKKRRRDGNHVTDSVCLNYFLSENNLKFQNQNLFIAHEIVQLKPIFDRSNTYQRFLSENAWVRSFLPNVFSHDVLMFGQKKNRRVFPKKMFSLIDRFVFWSDSLLFFLQRKYMEHHQTSETVGRNVAKFHPQDKKERILGKYRYRYFRMKKSFSQYGLPLVIQPWDKEYSRILTW